MCDDLNEHEELALGMSMNPSRESAVPGMAPARRLTMKRRSSESSKLSSNSELSLNASSEFSLPVPAGPAYETTTFETTEEWMHDVYAFCSPKLRRCRKIIRRCWRVVVFFASCGYCCAFGATSCAPKAKSRDTYEADENRAIRKIYSFSKKPLSRVDKLDRDRALAVDFPSGLTPDASPERFVPYPGDSDAAYLPKPRALPRARATAAAAREKKVLSSEDRRDSFIERRLAPLRGGVFGRRSIHHSFRIEDEEVAFDALTPNMKRRFSAPDAPPQDLPDGHLATSDASESTSASGSEAAAG